MDLGDFGAFEGVFFARVTIQRDLGWDSLGCPQSWTEAETHQELQLFPALQADISAFSPGAPQYRPPMGTGQAKLLRNPQHLPSLIIAEITQYQVFNQKAVKHDGRVRRRTEAFRGQFRVALSLHR
ncbi:MAG: hypothetical protein IPK53_18560 [bacterium]|nr:hypothetical protein [bacterium]